MAFTPFNFTKSWRNASDFPTFEPDEAKVRDDLQSLFDELKVGLNRLIGELKASNMPFTATAEIDSSDVQNAIENVQSQIASAVLGELPDGSVTAQKLSDGAVETDKIGDGAVTAAKIASGVVPVPTTITPKMDGEASQGTRTGFSRGDHVHPKDTSKADLSGGKVLPDQLSRSRVNVTASRALALTDDGKALYVSSSSAVTVTIPANSSVQLPIGSEIILYRAGTGTVTLAAASGVTLRCSDPLDSLKRYDTARLKKWEANVWSLELNHSGVSDGEVTAAKIAGGAITSAKLAGGAVTEDKLGANAVTTGKIASGAVTEINIAGGAVTAGKIAANAVSTLYTTTLNTAWDGSAAPYSKVQTISGILASDYPIVDLVPSSTYATAVSQEQEFAKIYRIVASANTLTFYAKEKPTVSLPIKVLCVRK